MTERHQNTIVDLSPEDVWSQLEADDNTALVDCRTQQEWQRIGTPDLSDIDRAMYLIEWRKAPDMSFNDAFAQQLDEATGASYPSKLFFICRSGARSKEAATYIQDLLSRKSIPCQCINVAEGFEGTQTLGAGASGWRNKNLPWVQNS